jgi:DNA-directed RNA polymerase specialized sigma24 family protein
MRAWWNSPKKAIRSPSPSCTGATSTVPTTWLSARWATHGTQRTQRPEPVENETLDDLSGPAGSGTIIGSTQAGIDPAIDGLSEPLRKALMSLSEGFRFAVVLCDLLGFPYSEAAEILEVQEGTIKSRIFRAREALAVALYEAGYELPVSRNQEDEGGVRSQGATGEQ